MAKTSGGVRNAGKKNERKGGTGLRASVTVFENGRMRTIESRFESKAKADKWIDGMSRRSTIIMSQVSDY